MDLADLLQIISAFVYTALAVASVRVWQRQRSPQSGWLAATFMALGGIVLITSLLPEVAPDAEFEQFSALGIYIDIVVIVLLAFPYLLHRFARSFKGAARIPDRLADIGMALIVVTTVLLPPLTGPAGDPTTAETAYRNVLLLWWVVMLFWVSVSLWRAGSGQPGVVRRRMRLMSMAALLMNAALLAGTVDDSQAEPSIAALLVSNLLGWASAAVFWVGFSPPLFLRRLWRAEEEAELRDADAVLVSALSGDVAASAIVEPAARLLGGTAAQVLDAEGGTLAEFGTLPSESSTDNIVRVEGRFATLVVGRSAYTPVFGDEEEALLRQLSAHLDLALDRLAAYEQSERARVTAEQTNAELQQLVYGISHDLRNPLVTVSGFLRLLGEEGDKLSDQGQMLLTRMRRSTDYMENLIDDLLQLSRVGRTNREIAPVRISEIVDQIATDLLPRYPGVSITASSTAVVMMNPVRAQQLFTNLLENAARHGGRSPLHIEVRDHDLDGASAIVDVADDGVGISPEHRAKVFQIFQRLEGFDAGAKGSGIGLTMCRRIVEDAGGAIEVSDAVGIGGTTIRLELPQATISRQATPQAPTQPATTGAH